MSVNSDALLMLSRIAQNAGVQKIISDILSKPEYRNVIVNRGNEVSDIAWDFCLMIQEEMQEAFREYLQDIYDGEI